MINRYLNGNMYHAYESLSGNPNLTWDIVRNNIDKSWKWRLFLSNSNIIPIFLQKTISNILGFLKFFPKKKEIILQKFDEYWEWDKMYNNQKIDWKIIRNKLDKSWKWDWASLNINIDIINCNPNEPSLKCIYKSIFKNGFYFK